MDIIVRTVPDVTEYVLEKFKRDEAGLYYNERMEYEIYRRVRKKKTLADNLQKGGQKEGQKGDDWKTLTPYEAEKLQKDMQKARQKASQKGDQKASLMETETETETETENNNINKKEKTGWTWRGVTQ